MAWPLGHHWHVVKSVQLIGIGCLIWSRIGSVAYWEATRSTHWINLLPFFEETIFFYIPGCSSEGHLRSCKLDVAKINPLQFLRTHLSHERMWPCGMGLGRRGTWHVSGPSWPLLVVVVPAAHASGFVVCRCVPNWPWGDTPAVRSIIQRLGHVILQGGASSYGCKPGIYVCQPVDCSICSHSNHTKDLKCLSHKYPQ